MIDNSFFSRAIIRWTMVGMMAGGVVFARPALAQLDWQLEPVDEYGFVGDHQAMVLDFDGHPAIAYYDRTLHEVRFARYDGIAWRFETIEIGIGFDDGGNPIFGGIDEAYSVCSGPKIALALDTANHFHVVYERIMPNDWLAVRYAVKESGYWTVQTVDGFSLREEHATWGLVPLHPSAVPSLAVDANRIPHVVYSRPSALAPGRYLIHTIPVGDTWEGEVIPTSEIPETMGPSWRQDRHANTTIAIDSMGRPHVCFASRTPSVPDWTLVRWARRDGLRDWFIREVDRSQAMPYEVPCSLALDGLDRPHIAYALQRSWLPGTSKIENRSLFYARWDGAAFQTETLMDGGAGPPCLALDNRGQPHVVYERIFSTTGLWPSYEVIHAVRTDGWTSETILSWGSIFSWEGTGKIVRGPSLALDNAGLPQVSFFDTRYQDLVFARFAEAWQVRTVDAPGDVGYTSIALDPGRIPHISYSALGDVIAGDPNGLRCADWEAGFWAITDVAPAVELGRGWDSSIAVPFVGAVGRGFPRIASYRPDTGDLEYSFFDGTSWTTEIVFDPANDDRADDVGQSCSMVLDPNPNIAYWDASNYRVKYAWKDASGWHVTYNTAGPALLRDSGYLSQVRPPVDSDYAHVRFVTYFDSRNGNLRCAIWDGTGWADELVDAGYSGAVVGIHNSLAWFKGKPAVAYYDVTNGRIQNIWRESDNPTSSVWYALPAWDTVTTGLAGVLGIALGTAPDTEVIAFAEYPVGLKVATKRVGSWQIEEIDSGTASHVSMDVMGREWISYRVGGMGAGELRLAFRTAAPYATYQALRPCEGTGFNPQSARVTRTSRRSSSPVLDPETKDDLAILRALRDMFAQSSEGIRLLNLYYQHAPETGAMGLTSPTLARNALGAIRNYLPGFLGLVNGEGEKYIITQSMVDQVNAVCDALADDGSTSLSTAINIERAKYNNLQDFVGMNFNEWAEALGVREKPTGVTLFHSYK